MGTDYAARDVADQLELHPESGLRLLGFLDSPPDKTTGLVAPLLGEPRDLVDVLDRFQPRVLIVGRGPWTRTSW